MGKRQILYWGSLASKSSTKSFLLKTVKIVNANQLWSLHACLILQPEIFIKIIWFLMVKNPLAVMRDRRTNFVRSNWMWATKTALLNENKRCRSKTSILKVMKPDIQTAFFFYKFFIAFPNEHENSGNNLKLISSFLRMLNISCFSNITSWYHICVPSN